TFQQDSVILLDRRQPADPGTDINTDAIRVFFADLEPSVIHGHLARRDGKVDKRIHFLDLFLLDVRCRVKISDLACNLTRVLRWIELRDATDPGLACAQRLPGFFHTYTKRSHQSQACDHNPSWLVRAHPAP